MNSPIFVWDVNTYINKNLCICMYIRGGQNEEILEIENQQMLDQAEMCRKWDTKNFGSKNLNLTPPQTPFQSKNGPKKGQKWQCSLALRGGQIFSKVMDSIIKKFDLTYILILKCVEILIFVIWTDIIQLIIPNFLNFNIIRVVSYLR